MHELDAFSGHVSAMGALELRGGAERTRSRPEAVIPAPPTMFDRGTSVRRPRVCGTSTRSAWRIPPSPPLFRLFQNAVDRPPAGGRLLKLQLTCQSVRKSGVYGLGAPSRRFDEERGGGECASVGNY
jgi:hypothetical protein